MKFLVLADENYIWVAKTWWTLLRDDYMISIKSWMDGLKIQWKIIFFSSVSQSMEIGLDGPNGLHVMCTVEMEGNRDKGYVMIPNQGRMVNLATVKARR